MTLPNKTTSAKILNKSVEYIKSGEYREAEILLKQIEHEEKAEIFNNLAVLYEITGKRESALKYYHKACTLDKGNHLYRENFNTLQ